MAFSEFIINNEVIFDVNMSELRPVNGNGESINLNAFNCTLSTIVN